MHECDKQTDERANNETEQSALLRVNVHTICGEIIAAYFTRL